MNTRIECSPRIIKRINIKEKTDDASKYDFYRQINQLSIIRLDNEADKMNYSSWLTRLDNETSDLKMHLIKILFISLRSDKSFQIFLKPPPDDLKDLELKSDNTMDMVKWLQDNNLPDESFTNKEKKDEIKHKRSAAVATNMRSYTTIKTSPYFVQSFYVRSDWPIYTWYNPSSIRLPSSFNHNQWELFLNRFQIVTEDKNSKSKHRNECDDIIPIDQVSKEIATTFNWHPYSILASEENRPKRTAGSIVIDLDVANQQCNQQEIDDAAFSIVVCKLLPGNKTLSPKMYSETLIPDAKFIFKMTGVTLVDYSNRKLIKGEELPFTCKIKQRKRAVKNSCEVKKVKTLCPCEKPMMTINCSKTELPCSKVARNPKEIIQTKPSTNTVNTESDCKFSTPNMTQQECKSNSKCLKRSVKKTKSVESCKFPKEADELSVIDGNVESNERKNRSTVLNAGGSSYNDSSNCDWTVSYSVETISTREPDRVCSSIAKCTPILLDHVAPVEPEDLQNASQHCSCSSVHQTAATPPRQSPQTMAAERIREPPLEKHRSRRSHGNPDVTNSERTPENNGRKRSASTRSARSTSDDGLRVGRLRLAKDLQNRSFPKTFAQSCRLLPSFALAEHQPPPTTPRRPDNVAAVTTSSSSSCSDRTRGSQQQQQQHEFAGPSGDNRSDTAWDLEVRGSGYSAFSAAIRSRTSTPLPADDVHDAAAADNDDLSDDCGTGETGRDWSAELHGIDRCQSWTRVMWTNNRFRDDDHDDNDDDGDDDDDDGGDAAGSLCTFTSSSDSSIEIRRTDDLHQRPPTSDDDRYTRDDGASTPELSDDVVSLRRADDDVSARGSSITTWPWSTSGPRVREFGDVGAPDRYDGTSCSSGGGNASAGRDAGGSDTDDDGARAAPRQRRRHY